jgi:hypothetical protein
MDRPQLSIGLAIMTQRKTAITVADPLGIEQLEAALRQLGNADVDADAFLDEHIEAFRQTVLLAIRETADAILSASMPHHLRVELEAQLAMLGRCMELADRYRKLRSLSRGRPTPAPTSPSRSIH